MNICIINTGGTISSVGATLSPMSAADFGTASKRILDPILQEDSPDLVLTYETSLRFPEAAKGTLDSTNLQPSDWCLMAQFILDNYTAFDGFVILHGTDSMDFTGGALPFLLNRVDANGFGTAVLSKPVIVTGSQVPMYYQPGEKTDPATLKLRVNTDAFQNFCGAVACARLGIPEVGVYFDSKLYRGNRVLKVNASEFRAFASPNYPALATYGIEMELEPGSMLPGPVGDDVSLDAPAVLQRAKDQLAAITSAIDSFPVMQFNAFPAAYNVKAATAVIADLINACIPTGLKSLILESYGEGNFPSGNPDSPADGAIYQALHAANKGDVVIVDCTQVIAGIVNNSAYASGAWLPTVGALSAADMTPMAAMAKSMILRSAACHNGWSTANVKMLVQLNLNGEMLNVSRLDSRTNSELLPGESISALDGSATLVNDPIHGPLLNSSAGALLWAPFGAKDAGKPGRLVMQNDGNLALYDDGNTALWATNTGVPSGASSALMITGSFVGDPPTQPANLVLSVFDYSGGRTTSTLYSQ